MHIDRDVVRPFASRLQYEAVPAPRSAVLALFTLVPQPVEVLAVATWESPDHGGSAAWTLVGLEHGGFVVVRATAGVGPDDGGEVVSARWHPDSHLRCVGVTGVLSEPLEAGDYAGSYSWLLRIEGEGELVLPTPAGGDAGHIEEVARRIQLVLGAQRDR